MSRIKITFNALDTRGRKALIPYMTTNNPYPETTVELMLTMAQAGANIIELNMPFSNPMADDPMIQRAAEHAVAKNIDIPQILDYVHRFRAHNDTTPIILINYANPIERYDINHFMADTKQANVDSILVVDYPPEECESFTTTLHEANMDPIFLLAPTSTEAHMKNVSHIASGYIYYVSLKNMTGAGHLDTTAVAEIIPKIRKHINTPVNIGFGIHDAQSTKAINTISNTVIINTAIVQLLKTQSHNNVTPANKRFITDIHTTLNSLKGTQT